MEEKPLSSPYVGLDPFDDAHADYFFGRTLDAEVIVDNVLAHKVTLLYGESGIGKSSLLNVGLRRALLARRQDVPLLFQREWREPGLVFEFLDHLGAPSQTGQLTVLVLDQFEEFFLYFPSPDKFAERLATITSSPVAPVHILFSMRSDAISLLDPLRIHLPDLFDATLELQHLDRNSVIEAIEGPIRVWNKNKHANVEVDRDFADALVRGLCEKGGSSNASDMPRIELAYLQLALERIWTAEGGPRATALRKSTLDKLKGVREIARRHVEEVLDPLPRHSKKVCRVVLDRLVTRSGSKIAYSTADLAEIAHVSEEKLKEILKPLVRARIVRRVEFRAPKPQSGFEIVHDVLARPLFEWAQRQKGGEELFERWKMTGSALLILLAATGALVLYHRSQRDRAERDEATSREFAALSANELSEGSADRSLLFSLIGRDVSDTAEARNSLFHALQRSRGLITVLGSQSGSITSLAFSSDGKSLVSGGQDGKILRWSITDRKSTVVSASSQPPISMLVFGKSGEVLTSDQDKAAILRNAETGRAIIPGEAGKLVQFASVDALGTVLASYTAIANSQQPDSGPYGEVSAWDIATGQQIDRMPLDLGSIPSANGRVTPTCLALSTNGSLLAIAATIESGAKSMVLVREIRSHKLINQPAVVPKPMTALAFSRGTTTLAAGSFDGDLLFLDLNTGKQSSEATGYHDPIEGMVFSSDGKLLLIRSKAHTLLWDTAAEGHLESAKERRFLPSTSLAISPDAKMLATGTADGRILLWDRDERSALATDLGPFHARIWSVAYASDSREVAIGTQDGTITLLNLTTATRFPLAPTHTGGVTALASAGDLLVSGAEDGQLILWDMTHRQMLRKHSLSAGPGDGPGPQAAIVSLAFQPGGKVFVAATTDGRVVLYETDKFKSAVFDQTLLSASGQQVITVAFNDSGSLLAAGGTSSELKLWDILPDKPGTNPRVLPVSSKFVSGVTFRHDSTQVAYSDFAGGLFVWDMAKSKQVKQLDFDPASSVAYSPDGRMLVSAKLGDRFITLRDAQTLTQLGDALPVQTGPGRADDPARAVHISFSPDARHLLTVGLDNSIMLWDLDPADWKDVACAIASNDLSRQELQAEWSARVGPGQLYPNVCANTTTPKH
jgi:WD40 repeat protein